MILCGCISAQVYLQINILYRVYVARFWYRAGCSGGFCEQTEPVSAGSKTDSLLAKDEPINNVGSASVLTFLTRGRKHFPTTPGREE